MMVFCLTIPANTSLIVDQPIPSFESSAYSIGTGVWIALLSVFIGAISWVVVWGRDGREKVLTPRQGRTPQA